MELGKDIFTHFYYVFRFDEGTVLQAAYYQQEDIFPHRLHLNSINIDSSDLEETSDIFENINEN